MRSVSTLFVVLVGCALGQVGSGPKSTSQSSRPEYSPSESAVTLTAHLVPDGDHTLLRVEWAGWPVDSILVISIDEEMGRTQQPMALFQERPIYDGLVRAAGRAGSDSLRVDTKEFMAHTHSLPGFTIYIASAVVVKALAAEGRGTKGILPPILQTIVVQTKDCATEFRTLAPAATRSAFVHAEALPLQVPPNTAGIVSTINILSIRGLLTIPSTNPGGQ